LLLKLFSFYKILFCKNRLKFLLFFIFTLLVFNFGFVNKAEAIKIGLLTSVEQAVIASSDGGIIVDNNTGATLAKASKMKPYRIKAVGDVLAIKSGDKYRKINTSSITLKPVSGFVSTKSRWYRGNLVVNAKDGKVTVINDIDMENYLLGVVPSEMPSKWNIEAHKAQAIAARSYAIANMGKRKSAGYDLKDTPEDQAYGGASAEYPRTTRAVQETKGIVITYNKKIIPAYYHASSGGHTVNSGDVWNSDLPYLRAVPSFDGQFSKNGHGVGMSQQGANNLASKGYNAYQILTYFYNNVKFGKLDPSIVI